MRIFIRGTLLVLVTALMGGCGASTGPKADAPSAARADKPAAANTGVMQSGGTNVLRLTLLPDSKCVAKDGSLHINAPQIEVEMWLVAGAKTVDEAAAHVSQQIVSEFKDFTVTHTTDLTVAGAPAKRLVGTGHEADDGDPGKADVIVFKVGNHIFVACTHGESLMSIAQDGMLTMVQSVQAP
ncbi:MAG TPA: hypothetical protein VFE47_29830 [Tepidisphaeraceae bacterium]|jgi:hypothetical protein|nr:hypothetical protein [Tepidisphaeraceae bacterium]